MALGGVGWSGGRGTSPSVRAPGSAQGLGRVATAPHRRAGRGAADLALSGGAVVRGRGVPRGDQGRRKDEARAEPPRHAPAGRPRRRPLGTSAHLRRGLTWAGGPSSRRAGPSPRRRPGPPGARPHLHGPPWPWPGRRAPAALPALLAAPGPAPGRPAASGRERTRSAAPRAPAPLAAAAATAAAAASPLPPAPLKAPSGGRAGPPAPPGRD